MYEVSFESHENCGSSFIHVFARGWLPWQCFVWQMKKKKHVLHIYTLGWSCMLSLNWMKIMEVVPPQDFATDQPTVHWLLYNKLHLAGDIQDNFLVCKICCTVIVENQSVCIKTIFKMMQTQVFAKFISKSLFFFHSGKKFLNCLPW